MKSSIKIFLSLSFLALMAGCGDDNALSPPKDAHWVTIEFTVPPGTTLLPAHLFYRSDICKAQQSNSDGGMDDIMGINGFDQAYNREGNSNTWKTQVAIEGGSPCKWQLNSVKISFKLNPNTSLVKERSLTDTNYIFDFYDYGLSDGYGTGKAKISRGDIHINSDFFPMTYFSHLTKQTDIELFAGDTKNEMWSRRYKLSDTKIITIAPHIYMDKLVSLESPNPPPGRITATYPDGTKEEINGIYPDYEKLLSMK